MFGRYQTYLDSRTRIRAFSTKQKLSLEPTATLSLHLAHSLPMVQILNDQTLVHLIFLRPDDIHA